MDVDGAGLGIDDPHEAGAVAQPHQSFVVDRRAPIARGDDLYDEVGDFFGVAGDVRVERYLLRGEEGDVGLAHGVGVALQPNAGVGRDERSEFARLDESPQAHDQFRYDFAVPVSCGHRLAQFPPDEFAANALGVEAQEVVRR